MTNRGKIGESLYLAFPRDLLAILSLLDRNLSVQLRTILICLVVFQLPQPSHARTNHLFENFSTERGLAGRLVRDIVQDEHGFIWFATESGLSRYDGYQFKNYYHDASDSNSLASSDIWRLHVDTNNNLWIASAAGLDRFDGVVLIITHTEEWKTVPFSKTSELSLALKASSMWELALASFASHSSKIILRFQKYYYRNRELITP